MSLQIKPIKFWGGGFAANIVKVAIILKELGLPSEVVQVPFADVKNPEYVAINPNGRLPAIHDPNTGITLWESGAIVEYLIDHYDQERRLSFAPGSAEAYHTKQWLYFQTTGQGPYYGQMTWFKMYHEEKLPSAIERYRKEIIRVTGVLEQYLTQQKQKYDGDSGDGPWLVGNKISYADIAFIPWQLMPERVLDKDDYDINQFPIVKNWLERMTSRQPIKAIIDEAIAQMK